MEGVVREVSSIVMEDEGTGSAEAVEDQYGAQLGAQQDPAEAMAEQEGDVQEIMEDDGEALMPVPEVSGAAADEETWQALLDDQDEEEDEEEKAGKDDDYCPANEDEEEEEGVEDLDFEAEKEEQERGEEEEEPFNSEDDDLLDDDHEGRKHKKGKKGSISPELASTPLTSAGTAYSPSSLAAEIFSVTIKKKMGGPTCDPDFAVPKKGKRKSNGSSAAAKKQPVKKRKGGWGPSSPNGSGGGYGSSATYSKRSSNKQAIDLMHRSVTAIPMSSVPVIFARVLKTLPPSDYDIYEIQNLIVTYALDEARYSGAAAAAAASSAAGTDESSEVSSGNGTATNTDTGTSIGTAVEGSEVGSGISDSTAATAATGDDGSSGTPSATMTTEATTTTETATSNASGNGINDGITESGDASGGSGSGSSSGGTIAGEVSDAGAEVGSNSEEDIEERIYQDVMRMVTTDKKFLHRHVPIGHSSFSHVQTDAAMLKKYEAFLNSPDERSKRRDYLSEGGSARHGWTEEELERYAEAIDRSGGNIRLAAKMLGTGLDRMHYFLFFYKRILSERIAAAGH